MTSQIDLTNYKLEPIKIDKTTMSKLLFLVLALLLILSPNFSSTTNKTQSAKRLKTPKFTKVEQNAFLQGLDYCLLDDYRQAPETIKALHHREFEELSAWLYFRKGHKVILTPATGDGGKDFVGEYYNANGKKVKYYAECKHYCQGSKVGTPHIQKLFGAMRMDKIRHAFFITSSRFSADAQKMVKHKKLPIELVDIDSIVKMLFELPQFDKIS